MRPHERWIWVEPIGFDVEQPDLGVGQYLDTCGFMPHTICLLMTSPDFVLSHEDREDEFDLPPDFCARDGHEFGRDRQRQVWTNRQLQQLIANLQARGVRVFLTVFTAWYRDRYHPEWLADHREVFMVFRELGVGYAINPTARLADGTPFADLWARKLVQTLSYYGFDGWQGADGWGPLSGPIYYVDFSDDTVEQFAKWLQSPSRAAGGELPPEVLVPWQDELTRLEARADWIWRNARREWIDFWSDRWADFWRTVMTALHAAGKKAVINSAWGRAPFEALYRYGVDYRKIADAGVDGMIVETAAAGLSLDPRAADDKRHYDFLSMFALVRAYLPDLKLIFLHNAHDIVEQWDAMRHVPAVLEKEIFSLANTYRVAPSRMGEAVPDPQLHPAADGFLVCLGDGFTRDEWAWLERKWQFSFSQSPRRIIGSTVVWSDALMQAEINDFTATRRPLSHRLLYELMAAGAPIGAMVRIEDVHAVQGPLLVLNGHLLSEAERSTLEAYEGGSVLSVEAEGSIASSLRSITFPTPPRAEDISGFIDQRGYWDHLIQRLPGDDFFADCSRQLWDMVMSGVSFPADEVTLSMMEMDTGKLRVAIKSKVWIYCKPEIDLGSEIRSIEVVTEFPAVRLRPQGSKFEVRVPPRGITVVDVEL
ncbi:MAG: hypothetical protein ACYC63_14335 [Armatimonadota bacterium]